MNFTVGTDAIVPMATEMDLLVKAGVDPMTVLVSATKRNAELIGWEKDIGTLEAGKLADILIIEGNPLVSMRDIAKVRWIIQGGLPYQPEELLPMVPSMTPGPGQND